VVYMTHHRDDGRSCCPRHNGSISSQKSRNCNLLSECIKKKAPTRGSTLVLCCLRYFCLVSLYPRIQRAGRLLNVSRGISQLVPTTDHFGKNAISSDYFIARQNFLQSEYSHFMAH
jgi:hypothetical protein